MPKIKKWSRRHRAEKRSESLVRSWVNDSNASAKVNVVLTRDDNNPRLDSSKNYIVVVKTGRKTPTPVRGLTNKKSFKDKQEALDFAIEWMKDHPSPRVNQKVDLGRGN